MKNEIKPTWFEKIVMIVIVLGPVLNIYASPLSMSLYGFCSFFLSIAYFVMFIAKGRNKSQRLFWYGLAVYFLYKGLNMLILGTTPLSIVEMFLGYFMAYGCFQRDYYIKCMKIFAAICIAFFFVQYFEFLRTGTRIPGILAFLPMNYGYNTSDFLEHVMYMERSSSFFSEPSHFAQFLIPLLAIELFYDKSKYHIWFAAVIFVVILLLQSGTGFIALIPVALFIIPYYKNAGMKGYQKFFMVLGIIVFIAGAVYVVVNDEIGEYITNRSAELNSQHEVGVGSSGFLRIWRGYYVFDDYNLLEKIFGVSNADIILGHVRSSGMFWGINAELYFNTISDILLHTGFVGLIIFIIVLSHIWKGNTICGKAIICTLIMISLVEQCYFSNVMLVHLLLAESMKIANTTSCCNDMSFQNV